MGASMGAGCMWWLAKVRLKGSQESQQQTETRLREAFAALASEALHANTQHMLTLAQEKLQQQQQVGEGVFSQKSQQVSQTLGALKEQLSEKLGVVSARLEQLEKERAQQYTSLDTRLSEAGKVIGTLQITAGSLREVLANSRARGQWGERMAADVLRLAGMQEGINFYAQSTLNDGSRPDFTFPLPSGRVLHMDVKFPLDGYMAAMNAPEGLEKEQAKRNFLQTTRGHIKTTSERSYRQQPDALDYVLVFIPNEQIYAYLFEFDHTLLEYAMQRKVILCSPTTLLAVLALVRQAEEAFRIDQKYADLAKHFASFSQQWRLFSESHDDVKKAFDKVARSFDDLVGKRTNLLDKSVDRLLANQRPQAETSLLPTGLLENSEAVAQS